MQEYQIASDSDMWQVECGWFKVTADVGDRFQVTNTEINRQIWKSLIVFKVITTVTQSEFKSNSRWY